jgi:2-polyprenyl-6-hydroxyphenyl methylase/3-demethylubiquinone-9 3-methyltransferase
MTAQRRMRPSSTLKPSPRTLLDAMTDADRAAAKRAFEAMMKMKKIDIAAIEAARRGTARD